jgi:hypothetical protein
MNARVLVLTSRRPARRQQAERLFAVLQDLRSTGTAIVSSASSREIGRWLIVWSCCAMVT